MKEEHILRENSVKWWKSLPKNVKIALSVEKPYVTYKDIDNMYQKLTVKLAQLIQE